MLGEWALRTITLFGNDPVLWLRMQQDYDLTKAAASLADEIAQIEIVTT